jgi:ATP-dependent Clp protease protease subunit
MPDPNLFSRVADLIDSRLLMARRLFLAEGVDGQSANEIIRKLWYLELVEPGKPFTLIINSPGGSVDAGYAIWDQVKMMTSPCSTLVTGMAASMGSILALCAKKGRRFSTRNARFMIHQPSMSGITGPAADIAIHAEEIVKTRERIVDLYVECTGQTHETIRRALERDKWMSPQEALDFGLVDKIIDSFDELD